MSLRARRSAIAVLSVFGMAEALYMLAHSRHLIDSLFCPIFGEGCDVVGRSKQATHFGVPNSAAGVVAYAAMALLAVWAGDRTPREAPVWPLGLAALSTGAMAASAYLVWAQARKVRAWCFWCLTSALINLAVFILSLIDAREAWSAFWRRAVGGSPAADAT